MKKNTTTILILAAAAAAAFFFMRKKTAQPVTDQATEEETKPGDTADADAEKTDAVVTAPKGQFSDAVEKGLQIAQTIKDAAVVVKSGDKTAVIKSGKKKGKKVKRPKLTPAQIEKACKGLKGKKRRQCIAIAQKKATFKPIFIPTANPFIPFVPVMKPEEA